MKLSAAPTTYDPGDQARMRQAIQDADRDNLKRGVAMDHLLLAAPNGTVGKLTVSDAGVLAWTPL